MRALDLMTSPVRFVSAEEPIEWAARMMEEWDLDLLPVSFGDTPSRVRGVITRSDIASRCEAKQHTGACRVADHMTAGPLVSVGPGASVDEVLFQMERSRRRRVLVVQSNRLLGIISLADVAKKIGHLEPRKVRRAAAAFTEATPQPAH